MKRVTALLLSIVICSSLCGCCLKHEWAEATCTAPMTCVKCGKTEGNPIEHSWADATCTEPKTCKVCGATEGESLGHNWIEATCVNPKSCSVCGKTEGKALGHDYEWEVEKEATYLAEGVEVGVCKQCGDQSKKTTSKLKAEYHWNVPIELSDTCTAGFYKEGDLYCFKLESDSLDTLTLIDMMSNGTIPNMSIMSQQIANILKKNNHSENGNYVYLTMSGYGRDWTLIMDYKSTDSGFVELKVNKEKEMIACSPYHEILD